MSRPSLIPAPFIVPANSSRFFASAEEARRQPEALFDPVWDEDDPYLFNGAFDGSLIAHDDAYCTSVSSLDGETQVPTLRYIDRVLRHVKSGAEVVDIGCGQGEFVAALHSRGVDAWGFDPVLKKPAPRLVARYWEPEDRPEASLLVMRCVLPHIPSPWEWIRAIGESHPDALLLIEFQRLEWAAEHGLWYQLSHDHVNLFRLVDFESRFDVLDSDTFLEGEWAWVLIRPSSYRRPTSRPCDATGLLDRLASARRSALVELAGSDSVVLWGAAGKGIVLAHALDRAGAPLRYAVDADPARWGRFMEVSGLRIVSPEEGARELGGSTLVVCNPRHEEAVRAFIQQLG